MQLPEPVERLTSLIARLPGIGERGAQRLVLHMLRQDPEFARGLGEALLALHAGTHRCSRCHHLASGDLCPVCADPTRDSHLLCVVEYVPDVLAIERSGEFHGLYHVLGGVLSPLRGMGPRDLNLHDLPARVDALRPGEVVIATPISVEGEATASYVQELLRGRPVRLSRIASGVPHGADLGWLDQGTLGRALRARQPMD
jgi:recombination protein RecR